MAPERIVTRIDHDVHHLLVAFLHSPLEDVATYLGAVLLVTVVAIGATCVPALRATCVDAKTAIAGD